MREGWRHAQLAAVLRQVSRTVEVAQLQQVPFAGVRWYAEGVYAREVIPADQVKTKKLNQLRAGDVTYNRMWATKASFGVAGPDVDGCLVTNDFPVFEADLTQVTAAYLELVFQGTAFQDEASARSTGTTERRRLKERDFLSIEVPLPPLPEQRRIVDLIGAVDETIQASETQAEALTVALGEIRDREFGRHQSVPLGSLIDSIGGGRSPSASDERPKSNELGVLKVSAIGEYGFRAEESKRVSDGSAFTDAMRVRSGDILISRANTAERVGMVCQVETDHPNLFLSDKTLRLSPKNNVDPACLTAALQTTRVRQQFSAAGSGTSSSMKNISQSDIRGATVGWPNDLTVQRELASLLASLAEARNAALSAARAYRLLRTELLLALLSGKHRIGPLYDPLMHGSAS